MMSFFGLREWKFCNKNIDRLANLLKSQEKLQSKKHSDATKNRWQNGMNSMMTTTAAAVETHKNGMINGNYITDKQQYKRESQNYLEFDMQTINWDEYFFHYLPGIKKYFFKETDTKKCLKHYGRYVYTYELKLSINLYLSFLFKIFFL